MRIPTRLVLAAFPLAMSLQGQAPPIPVPASSPGDDLVLQGLLREALANQPDIQRNRSLIEAEKERVPQAKALPDPSLTIGLQNDGFKRIEVGRMETSYYQVMAIQPLPWPGKRDLRGQIAGLGSQSQRSALQRTQLSLEADVKRAYFGLLLVRDQLALLDQQAQLLEKAEGITKVRYEVGLGSQADLLRAQLERSRLRQARFALGAEERALLAELNRLRAADPSAAIPTARSVASFPRLELEPIESLYQRSETRSPEVRLAQLGIQQAERSLDLARLDQRPDFAVSAGVMPRGGLDPMWQVGFSIGLPIYSKQKQQRAVAEQEWRRKAGGSELASVKLLLHQRIQERMAQLEATLETLRLYREGLLFQSESSFAANLAQYEAGRTPFLSVLEALNGWIADRSAYLQTHAQALALGIAQEELALGPTVPIRGQALGSPAMGMGGSPSGSAVKTSKPNPAAASTEGGGAMKSM